MNSKHKKTYSYKLGLRMISCLLSVLMFSQIIDFTTIAAYALDDSDNELYESTDSDINTDTESDTEEDSGVVNQEITYEDLILSENLTLSSDIDVNNMSFNNGTLDLNGYQLNVHGNFNISGGTINVNKGYINCSGNIEFSSRSSLVMDNINDYILVGGDFIWNQGNNNNISSGTIEIKGNFNDNNSSSYYCFISTGENKLILSGNTKQTIVQASTYSHINSIEINNQSEEGIVAETPIIAEEIVRNGAKISYPTSGKFGWTLQDDEEFTGDLYLIGDELNLNGHTLTVHGNLIQAAGRVVLNKGTLNVDHDYKLQSYTYYEDTEKVYSYSSGYLIMSNSEDTVNVGGDFCTASVNDHSGKLTNGTFSVKGNFTQIITNSKFNFAASNEHEVVFNGENSQTITFDDSHYNTSHFAKIKFTNNSEDGITITNRACVINTLTNKTSKVTGYIDLDKDAEITDSIYNGSLRIVRSYNLDNDLTVSGDLYVGSVLDLKGKTLEVKGNIIINSDYIRISKGDLICRGDLECAESYRNSSYLYMTDSDDYAIIYGDFTCNSYYGNSNITAGTLEIKGNFTQNVTNWKDNFTATGTHKVIFSGNKKQTISFETPKSYFNIVEITNQSDDGVVINENFNCSQLIRNGNNVTTIGGGRIGWTLTADETIDTDLIISADELNLNGHTLTVKGDLIQSGGTVNINGGNLVVNGDYRIQSVNKDENDNVEYSQSTGYLIMTNSDDTVTVKGSFFTSSTNSHNGKLTNGTLYVGGNFIQQVTDSKFNFAATGSHKVIFNGEGTQTITFGDSYYNTSHFSELEFANSSENGITITDRACVISKLTNTTSKVTGYIDLDKDSEIVGNSYNGSIRILRSYDLSKDITVSGDLYVGSVLDLKGKTLDVKGNIVIHNSCIRISEGKLICRGDLECEYGYMSSSYIDMTNANDYAIIYGDFIYDSFYGNSRMTAGTLEIKGNFTHYAKASKDNFTATGTHRVVFSGDTKQTISFSTSKSYFNIVEIKNYSEDGIYCVNGLNVSEIITNGCNITYSGSEVLGWKLTDDLFIDGDLVLVGDTLDLNGYELNVNGNLIQKAGTVFVNHGSLIVTNDYRIQNPIPDSDNTYDYSQGILKMTSSDDYVSVGGVFATSSNKSHEGYLTAGIIEVKGSFYQYNTSVSNNFKTSDDFIIKFNGSEKQTIHFDSASNSKLSNVVFDNSSKSGIQIDNSVTVSNSVTDIGKNVSGYTNISSLNIFESNYFSGSVSISDTIKMSKDFNCGGSIRIGADFDLNGKTLTVDSVEINSSSFTLNGGSVNCNNNFTVNSYGKIVMTDSSDYIVVGNNFKTESRYSHSGNLTNGILEIKGDFAQNGTSDSFLCSGNHQVLLSGKSGTSGRVYKQTIKFSSPGNSKFNKLTITRPLNYYSFNADTSLICNQFLTDIKDIEAPSKVTGLAVTNVTTTTASITWNPSSDNIKILGYEIYRNNEKVATVTATSFVDNKLSPETSYTYKVCAFDEVRNVSEFSVPISVTTSSDTISPEIPKSLKVHSRTGSSITISWLPSYDNVECTGYKIFRNNQEIANITDTSYKDSSVTIGTEYVYKIKAFDKAGNQSDFSDSVTGYVVKPSITTVSPKEYTVIGTGKATISVHFLNTGNSTGNKVKFEYSSDGENWNDISKNLISQQNYSSTELCSSCLWDTSSLSSGEYTVKCTLFDADNNQTEKETTYYIDNSPPSKVKNVLATTKNAVITVQWDVADDADCSSYNLYRADNLTDFVKIKSINDRNTISYIDKNIEENKSYSYYVTSLDEFGHESEKSNIVTIVSSLDEEKPYITSISKASRINGETQIEVAAHDNIAVSHILLQYYDSDEEKWVDIGTGNAVNGKAQIKWDTTVLSDGSYQVRAFAWDTGGNKSEQDFTESLVIDNTGPGKIIISDVTSTSSYVSIQWKDVNVNDFGYFQVEQKIGSEFVSVGTVNEVLGMHVTGLSSNTDYKFRVVGYDDIGNRGETSDVIEITTTSDNVNPYIEKFSPAQSYFKNKIDFSITAKDNCTVAGIKLYSSSDKENWNLITELNCEEAVSKYIFDYQYNVSDVQEGVIYFKAVAIDSANNESSPVIVAHSIDHTAPAAINDLKAVDKSGYISLTWTALDDDIESFVIYRADEDNGIYSELVSKCTTKNYYDTDVEYGKVYSYKIKAVDAAGNISELSNETIVQVSEDTNSPEIYGVTPNDGSIVGQNTKICVVAYDARLKTIYVEYRKKDSNDIWLELGRKDSINNSYDKIELEWNTLDLTEGDYEFRAFAIDYSNNASDPYDFTYTLDNNAPQKPVVKIEQGNFQLQLDWNKAEETDFSHYLIYRKSAIDRDYSLIEKTTESSYTDVDVEPNLVYNYKVEAYDLCGNYSVSDMVFDYALDEDTIPPTAIVPDEIISLVGQEITLDGTESYDNVKIKSFLWDMDNGDTIKGARATYTYNSAGNYNAVLTVTDTAGNKDSMEFRITVLERENCGSKTFRIVNRNNEPLMYAYVYLYSEDGNNKALRTDSTGLITISGSFGEQKIALYKQGYLPKEHIFTLNSVGNQNPESIVLQEGDVALGNIDVHRMNLEEMVEAGIDFSDPANYDSFTFNLELMFMEESIPTYVHYIYPGFGGSYIKRNLGGGKCVISRSGGGSTHFKAVNLEDIDPEIEEPIIYYIDKMDSISWMKEMFNVRVGVFNTAAPKFVLENCMASLQLPDGLSIVNSNRGQSLTKSLGSIKGHETSSAEWCIRGDKAGKYNLTANFNATLMPFNAPLDVSFETEQPFEVEAGKGLNIYIYPETAAYKDKDYYIQYELRNESKREFYNVKTTFGEYTDPGYEEEIKIKTPDGNTYMQSYKEESYVIPDVNSCKSVPVISGGDSITVGVFSPGESIYGTYKVTIDWTGEKEDSYFKLIDYIVEEIGESNTGVNVHVIPISSHITKYNLEIRAVGNTWGDPVNMTTGAFTDSINALMLNSNPALTFDLDYSSLNEAKGDCGYGWTHNFEGKIDYSYGTAKLYFNSESFITFVSQDQYNRNVTGQVDGNNIIISPSDEEKDENFVCISTGMEDYKLVRSAEGDFTVTLPNGEIWKFDKLGKLTKIIQTNGRYADITYGHNSMTVMEPTSGMSFTLNYNDEGQITSVVDYTGRSATFAYENDCLVKYTNPLGDSIYYNYDENHRIISEQNNYNVTFVVNTYDDEGRVIEQDDALQETPLTYYSYKVDDDGDTVTTGTDRNGNNVVYRADRLGHITEIVDRNGNSTKYEYDSNGNLISETNGVGGKTTYSYDDKGNIISVTDCSGNVTQMSYDSAGNILQLTSPLGAVNFYTYNSKNYPTSSVESSGRTKSYTYDDNGFVLSETTNGLGTIYYSYTNGLQTGYTDYKGQSSTKIYDAYGNVKQEIAADGSTTTYTYDAIGRQIGITDSTGGTISYTYDSNGNVISTTDENGGVVTFEYNNNNWLVKSVDKRGGVTLYEYDFEGRNTKTTHPDGSVTTTEYNAEGCAVKTIDEENGIYLYEYDSANRIIGETLPNGSKTTHEYYPNGKEKKKTYADGSYISYSYDSSWRMTQSVDNLGNIYKYEYDDYGNVTKIVDPLDNVVKNEYDIYSRMISSTDANGNKTYFEYDANGNCIKKTNSNGLVSVITYDSQNHPTKVTAKTEYGDYSVSYKYDALGRITEYTDEEGNVFKTEYDHLGNITAVIDAKGNVTERAEYDSAGNVTKVTNALNVSSEYSYNSTNSLIKTTSDVGTATQAITTYSYDALDRLIKSVDAESGESSYTYDSVGNITSVKDPNGGISTYTYDSMGRMTESINAIGSKNTYTYNAAGLLAEAKNAKNQSTTYQYDALGRITSVTDNLGTISYTYDNNGNVLTVTDASGTITREYDSMNRVTKYTDPRGNVVNYGYDTLGNLVTLTYPGGEIVRYSYYPTGRLKSVTDWNNKITNYEYDGNGRITKLSRPDGSVETYEYDADGKLTKQTDINGDKVINSFTYTYDTAGNIIKIDSENTAEETEKLQSVSMEYDAANRLVKYNGEEVKYDADGNMTYGPLNGEMATFTYDCRNRLISAENTSYSYDAENNRISVTVGNTKTEYVVENNSSSLSKILSSTTSGKTTLFLYGDGLLAQENEEDGYLYYHFNNIGSTTAVTNADGELKYAFSYGTYGELLSGDTHGIMFLYNGQYGVVTDSNGLYYMRARYYNVDIKRFINQDVVEGNITNSPSLNKYAYCQGNPVSLLDPFGLSPQNSVSTGGHLILDALGFIPALGAIPDLINALWYLAEGNYAYAAMSAIAAIPGLGDGFGLFAEGTKYACMFKKVMFGLGALSNLDKIKDSLKGIGEISGYLAQKHLIDGAAWDMDSAYAVQEGLFLVAQTLLSAVGLGKSLEGFKSSQCFVAGTLVLTNEGNKPIEEIKAGDLVYSTNPETGESEYKEVARVFRRESSIIIHIFVNGEEIETTPNHPFWVEDQWVNAKDLREGDVLSLADGSTATITKTYGEQLDEPVIVYNFEVKDFHTYYVTDTSVLVHNASKYVDDEGTGENYNGTHTESPSDDPISVTAGPNVKDHYKKHKSLLEDLLGKKYPSFKKSNNAEEFLNDLSDLVNDGTFKYVYQSTAMKDGPILDIYKGNGLVLATKTDGEWVTLLEDGMGMAIQFEMFKK